MSAEDYFEKKLRLKEARTQWLYRYYLGLFLEHAGLTSEELYRAQLKALEVEDPREAVYVVDLVEDYLVSLEKGGYSNSQCNMVLKAVNFFFAANKLVFPTKDLRRRAVYSGKRRARKAEVLEMYRYCRGDFKQRNRALVMVAKDSGLRVSDISALDVRRFLDARDVWYKGERFKAFKPIKTVKTGDVAYPHLGPEAVAEVEQYLGDRKNGPFFVGRYGVRMTPTAMSTQFTRLSSTLGDLADEVSGHSLRKFFSTMMEEVMPVPWVKLLMGKSVGPYSVPLEKLTEKYIENYGQLRIFQYTGGVDPEEFESMKEEMKSLRSMVVTGLYRYKAREELEGR